MPPRSQGWVHGPNPGMILSLGAASLVLSPALASTVGVIIARAREARIYSGMGESFCLTRVPYMLEMDVRWLHLVASGRNGMHVWHLGEESNISNCGDAAAQQIGGLMRPPEDGWMDGICWISVGGNVLCLEFDERRKKPDIAQPTRKPFLLEPSKGEENRLDGDRKYKRRGTVTSPPPAFARPTLALSLSYSVAFWLPLFPGYPVVASTVSCVVWSPVLSPFPSPLSATSPPPSPARVDRFADPDLLAINRLDRKFAPELARACICRFPRPDLTISESGRASPH
ncbi:hypothetical protein An07g01460 [Aspergillus niger]|uniref:Uncharacterized protein n=2 Tax=Aspergillus niger TaxID=5061 RepID=A2QMB0_ASPNC|nr:hypothetical protein An07g01460 [Aspergillus niger]CAK96591.1 hypothetical protein An07g01460 [Aspergillus niger]